MRTALLTAALALSACNPAASDNGAVAPAAEAPRSPATAAAPRAGQAAPAAPAASPAPPAPSAAGPVVMEEKTPLLDFSYRWPAEAAAIPTLDGRLRADARTSRQRALNAATADRKERGTEFPFYPHELTKTWTVEGDTPGLLALRDEFYTFTGGAHGMSGFEFILWDRAADRDIAVKDLFVDWPRARALLVRAFCPALDRARVAKRGGTVDKSDEMFGQCVALEQQVLVPSDVRNGGFTTIRVLIGPYEAGPYAEGTYDVALPVTPALVALLKPERAGTLAAR